VLAGSLLQEKVLGQGTLISDTGSLLLLSHQTLPFVLAYNLSLIKQQH
jgi:hypothetical protein